MRMFLDFDAVIKDLESGFGDIVSYSFEINRRISLHGSPFFQPCDDIIDCFTKELDVMELEAIDQSIQDRQMSVKVQPPTDIRRRYETDGKRQIEKSRSTPMAIEVNSQFPHHNQR